MRKRTNGYIRQGGRWAEASGSVPPCFPGGRGFASVLVAGSLRSYFSSRFGPSFLTRFGPSFFAVDYGV